MTVKQLRPFYTDEELAALYATPYDHTRWDDHKVRIQRTVEIATVFGGTYGRWQSGIDLTCGDGAILSRLVAGGVLQYGYFGDMVQMAGPPYLDVIGRVEDTIVTHMAEAGRTPPYDLYVCSETLEHVRDPWALLANARQLADYMVLSTPIDEADDVGNPEHYWSWGVDDVMHMLRDAGWTVDDNDVTVLPLPFYQFQVWCCT